MGASIWSASSTPLVPSQAYVLTERFIATAGQTLFTLTNFTYQFGGIALRVFRNGQLMTWSDDYNETSTSSFTFHTGMNAGDEIFVIGNSFVSPGSPAGSTISYNAGNGGLTTDVQSRMRLYAQSPDDFAGADDTAKVQAAFDSGKPIIFDRDYSVTTVTINNKIYLDFNGFSLFGIASSATDCILRIKMEGGTIIAMSVIGQMHLTSTEYYTCAVWWYNAAASSQYNSIFGFKIAYITRGLVYGELPGNTSTMFAQSENNIYGFRTRGVRNPFYNNHDNGFIFFSEPIFVSYYEEWFDTASFDWFQARCFDNQSGVVTAHGGELQHSGATKSWPNPAGTNYCYAANLNVCKFFGTNIETSVPLSVTGSEVYFENCSFLETTDATPQFVFRSWVNGGDLNARDCDFKRSYISGGTNMPFVCAEGNSFGYVNIQGGSIRDRLYSPASGYTPLVENQLRARFNDVLFYSAADGIPSHYLNNVSETSIIPANVEVFGTTTNGWNKIVSSGTGTLGVSAGAGPTLPDVGRQLSVTANAASNILAYAIPVAVPGTLDAADVIAGGFKVRPGEVYRYESWVKWTTATEVNVYIQANYYNTSGVYVSSQSFLDSTFNTTNYYSSAKTFSANAWYFVSSEVIVPSNIGYMTLSVRSLSVTNPCNILVYDVRLYRQRTPNYY